MAMKFNLYDSHGFTKSQILAKEKRNNQVKKIFKILIFLVCSLFLLVAVTKIPGIINGFVKPFQNVPNDLVNYNKLNLKFRTNILLITYSGNKLKEISIGSLDPTDKKAQLLKISPNQTVATTDGDLSLEQLFARKATNERFLERLTAKLIENLGLLIDGYILIEQENSWQSKESLEEIVNYIYSPQFFLGILGKKNYLDEHLKTNLTVGELNALINKIKSLKPERFTLTDLSKAVNEQGYLHPGLLRGELDLLLNDAAILNEGLTVEVINASEIDGVASIFKDIFTNMGINVVKVSVEGFQEKSEIIVNGKNSLNDRLKNLFKERIKSRDDELLGVDAKIIIGSAIAKYFAY